MMNFALKNGGFCIKNDDCHANFKVWTREGKKVGVTVPDGCLLVQAGQQLEYLTGGHVKAGYHEVILTGKRQ